MNRRPTSRCTVKIARAAAAAEGENGGICSEGRGTWRGLLLLEMGRPSPGEGEKDEGFDKYDTDSVGQLWTTSDWLHQQEDGVP